MSVSHHAQVGGNCVRFLGQEGGLYVSYSISANFKPTGNLFQWHERFYKRFFLGKEHCSGGENFLQYSIPLDINLRQKSVIFGHNNSKS